MIHMIRMNLLHRGPPQKAFPSVYVTVFNLMSFLSKRLGLIGHENGKFQAIISVYIGLYFHLHRSCGSCMRVGNSVLS